MLQRREHQEKRELLKRTRIAAGLVSERFPSVSGMAVRMLYLNKSTGAVLMMRTVNYFPTSHAYFIMECVTDGCTGGGYDLTTVISNLIKGRKETGRGKFICPGNRTAGHEGFSYEISISYGK